MLLVITPRGSELRCRFEIGELASLVIHDQRAHQAGDASLPGPQSFPWQALTSLTASASAEVADEVDHPHGHPPPLQEPPRSHRQDHTIFSEEGGDLGRPSHLLQ